jgi:hypothetical protein
MVCVTVCVGVRGLLPSTFRVVRFEGCFRAAELFLLFLFFRTPEERALTGSRGTLAFDSGTAGHRAGVRR